MKKTKLVIADTDARFLDEFARYLSNYPEFEIVGTAENGLDALSKVQDNHPDLLLTEMLLPRMDGICLLKNIRKMKHPPMTICLSDFYSDFCEVSALNNNAGYFIFKPVAFHELAIVLQEYARYLDSLRQAETLRKEVDEGNDIASMVFDIVHNMGFSSKYSGSNYLAESVILACESPMAIRNLSHELYQEIACRMHTTPSCVERSIRTAIAAANEDGHLESMLGESPTNKRCICYIVNELKNKN